MYALTKKLIRIPTTAREIRISKRYVQCVDDKMPPFNIWYLYNCNY